MIDPITVVVVLDMPLPRAFEIFVEDIDRWWPKTPFSLGQGRVELPRTEGGDITETTEDGSVHVWGKVTVFDPPARLAILWHVGRDAAIGTDIDIRFAPTDDGRTGVTLVHSGWERLGEDAGERRGNYQTGWTTILPKGFQPFAEAKFASEKENT